jgi:hypothetical protein
MRCRPSSLYGLVGLPAYAFDSAVTVWGTNLNEALHKAAEGAKDSKAATRSQQAVLRRWLGAGAAQYRDPAKQ